MNTRRLAAFVAALALIAAAPATSEADSGSIAVMSNTYAGTPGSANVGVSITVDKTTCDLESSYCGWFPIVAEVDPSQPCTPYALRFVGSVVDGSGTYTEDLGTEAFTGTSTKLCLYVSSDEYHYIAETVVALNSAPASAPPRPLAAPAPPSSTGTHPLSIADAVATLPGILRDKFGSRFSLRKRYHRACGRYTTAKVRCRVRWDYGSRYRYSGTVTIRSDPADPIGSVLYTSAIRRKRLHHRANSAPPPASSPSPSCDPNYSGCLDPNASDYDCAGGSGDGPLYTGTVRVLGDDHYGLDRDGDGIGCDS